jgi:hypothetical protein
VLERLERDFDKAKRIVLPNLNDGTQTSKVLARLAATYDYEQIGRGRLTNDARIAMSAGRSGITVITSNARNFMRLAEFRPFHWRVQTFPTHSGTPLSTKGSQRFSTVSPQSAYRDPERVRRVEALRGLALSSFELGDHLERGKTSHRRNERHTHPTDIRKELLVSDQALSAFFM